MNTVHAHVGTLFEGIMTKLECWYCGKPLEKGETCCKILTCKICGKKVPCAKESQEKELCAFCWHYANV